MMPRDLIYEMCRTGNGRWVELDRALREAGFIKPDAPKNSGWYLNRYIHAMLRDCEIVRVAYGRYAAICPRGRKR